MVKWFWMMGTLDAMVLLATLVAGLNSKGHNDGGREMGLFFFVLLPLVALTVTMLVFQFVPWVPLRFACVAVVCLPSVWFAYLLASNLGAHFLNAPQNRYQDPNMRKLVKAIGRLDVEEVRRWAPLMDRTVNQGDPTAPLRLVIEKMVQEQKTHLPARIEPHLAIFKILIDNGAKPEEAMQVACWTRSGEVFHWMFEAGANPNYDTQYGGPVFFGCLDSGLGVPGSALPMVKEFVAAGVDVNRRGNIGLQPATYAIECDQFDAALYLLEHGAEVNGELKERIRIKLERAQDPVPRELQELAHRFGT